MRFPFSALAAVAAASLTAMGASAQSARDIRGASPYVAIAGEAPPRLIVDAPLPDQLAKGIVQIQYRVENLHIVPVFGSGALNVSPRVGHLHVTVDELPWHWADASDSNTIDVVGMPPGPHRILIELVDAAHRPFPDKSQLVTFTIPQTASHVH